jgi:hypothetical protein
LKTFMRSIFESFYRSNGEDYDRIKYIFIFLNIDKLEYIASAVRRPNLINFNFNISSFILIYLHLSSFIFNKWTISLTHSGFIIEPASPSNEVYIRSFNKSASASASAFAFASAFASA